MKAIALCTIGALVLVIAAALGPAAIAGGKPKTGDERAAISRTDLVRVNNRPPRTSRTHGQDASLGAPLGERAELAEQVF